MRDFLEDIGQYRRTLIKNISTSLTGMAHGIIRATRLMYQCSSLKKLEIKLGKTVLSLTPNPLQDKITGRMIDILLKLRGINELTIQPPEWIIHPMLKGSGFHMQELKYQNEQKHIAGEVERLLRVNVCKERTPGDSLSAETLARRQAEKDKQREENTKKHLEWQTIKRKQVSWNIVSTLVV